MTSRTSVNPQPILQLLQTDFVVPAGTSADTHFDSLELDSLVLIELAVILTQQYGVEVSGDELASAGTVSKVAALLSAKGAEG